MPLSSIFSLFVALVILAVIPGPGVFAVVARSMASGFFHGLVTVFGIVCGDYIFILLSIHGLSALASAMGDFSVFIKYVGAIYLVWPGIKLFLERHASVDIQPACRVS